MIYTIFYGVIIVCIIHFISVSHVPSMGHFPTFPIPDQNGLFTMPQDNVNKNINVTLENHDMWKRFNKIGTEMILTKGGRSVLVFYSNQ